MTFKDPGSNEGLLSAFNCHVCLISFNLPAYFVFYHINIFEGLGQFCKISLSLDFSDSFLTIHLNFFFFLQECYMGDITPHYC